MNPADSLRVEGVRHAYGPVSVLHGVNLDVPAGAVLALLGPSGCGKSTLLRVVAGLERPEAGRVLLGNDDVTARPPERRDLSLVFQDYALFPHLDVLGNVAYGPRARGLPRREAEDRAREALALVGLTDLAGRRPNELSGGQQQRVALARALAPRPRLLLLDEPLSNLDEQRREALQDDLRDLFGRLSVTVVLVTHDQREARALASHVAVMRAGRVLQQGRVEDVYERPASAWTAAFLGHRNLLTQPGGRLLVPEDAVWLGEGGRPHPVLHTRPDGSGVRVRVRHPLGDLDLRLSAREARLVDRAGLRVEIDRDACLLLPDDLDGSPA